MDLRRDHHRIELRICFGADGGKQARPEEGEKSQGAAAAKPCLIENVQHSFRLKGEPKRSGLLGWRFDLESTERVDQRGFAGVAVETADASWT